MAEFTWEARGRTGEVRRGVMEADTEEAVNQRLRQQQLAPVRVQKKRKLADFSVGSGVNTRDLVTFTRLFATMIDAGLPLVQCLDILSSQQTNKKFGAVLKDVKNSVEGGSSFSESLRRHPKVFDELFVNLVQAGETGGILDSIMTRLSVYLEKRQKLIRQVRGAMVYPTMPFNAPRAVDRWPDVRTPLGYGNWLGLPEVSVPAGLGADGMPVETPGAAA